MEAAIFWHAKEVLVPRYDYKCPECEHEFEVKQSFSEDPVASCPNCATASQRVFHAVPVVFKGSGFYVNEYGKGSGRDQQSSDDSAKSDTKSESKSETKSEAKSDSKSESKSETKSEAKSEGKSDSTGSKKEAAGTK